MNSNAIDNTTCFAEHKARKIQCNKTECRMWMNCGKSLNCCLIASEEEHTLQEIGDIFGVTRMRICQLEKAIIRKIDSNSGVSK